MAGTSLLLLLDDIATILDDVAVMTKVAAKKAAGVLGDDLALNAEQVSGVKADRELPVVWAVAKGSFRNKLILVPAALAISALIPWLVTPLLILGGLYLCFEGVEKLLHSPAKDESHREKLRKAIAEPAVDMVAFEKKKIQGAIRTDFVLSAEIIVIALGIVANQPFVTQVAVVSTIAILMTVGVYGLVAGIVKLDDAGLFLSQLPGEGLLQRLRRKFGSLLVTFAPYLMKGLSIVGTAAMFLVGGGILTHGIHSLAVMIEQAALQVATLPGIGPLLAVLTPSLLNALAGIIAGAIALLIVNSATGLYQRIKS